MQVTCPCPCGFTFDAKRHAKGAAEALKWKVLPPANVKLLSWWLSHHPYERMTKDRVDELFAKTSISGLVARVSELYALDLVKRFEKDKVYLTVTYQLNLQKAIQVLNNGGRLK